MIRKLILVFLVLFGLLTLFMSSSVLFDWFGIRAKEGNFVPFIVWANWLCGFLYLTAAYAILKSKTSSKIPLISALVILIIAYIGLFIHIDQGGLYENKTMGAMAFRIAVTTLFLLATIKFIKK